MKKASSNPQETLGPLPCGIQVSLVENGRLYIPPQTTLKPKPIAGGKIETGFLVAAASASIVKEPRNPCGCGECDLCDAFLDFITLLREH